MSTNQKPEKALYVPPSLRKKQSSASLCNNTDEQVQTKTNSRSVKGNIYSFHLKTHFYPEVNSVSRPSAGSEKDGKYLHDLFTQLSISGNRGSTRSGKYYSDIEVTKRSPKTIDQEKEGKTDSKSEPSINYSQFQHVLELYNFKKELQTEDLQSELFGFEDSGFYLKWIDQTHCLAVFSSPTEAQRALSQISGLLVKARRLEDASLESRCKLASSPGDWAMPYKRRPPTTTATARRLISGHLGVSRVNPKSPEVLERERRDKEALAEARVHYTRRKKAQKSIWDDESYDIT